MSQRQIRDLLDVSDRVIRRELLRHGLTLTYPQKKEKIPDRGSEAPG
jgi:hypothetical protein